MVIGLLWHWISFSFKEEWTVQNFDLKVFSWRCCWGCTTQLLDTFMKFLKFCCCCIWPLWQFRRTTLIFEQIVNNILFSQVNFHQQARLIFNYIISQRSNKSILNWLHTTRRPNNNNNTNMNSKLLSSKRKKKK